MPFTASQLTFDTTDGQRVSVDSPQLVVAGYTGRDQTAVQAHIDELAAIGVPAPTSVPEFYPLDAELLTTAQEVSVPGGNTSGEVEPVILRVNGIYYLGVGSDHTDRDLERTSVPAAKAGCPKPLGTTIVKMPPDPATWTWDSLSISSTVDQHPYQNDRLTAIRRPDDLLRQLDKRFDDLGDSVVVYMGTVPLLSDGFISGKTWDITLHLPDLSSELNHTYVVTPGQRE